MNRIKMRCPVCGDRIQEGRKDFYCRSYAFGHRCNFRISKTDNPITEKTGLPLERRELLQFLRPMGYAVPVCNRYCQFQIILDGKDWYIRTSEFDIKEVSNLMEGGDEHEDNKSS